MRHSPGAACAARARRTAPSGRSIRSIRCSAGCASRRSAARPARAIEEHLRYVADRVEVVEIDAADLILPIGAHARGPVFRDFAELARRQLAAGDLSPAFALDRNAVEHGRAGEPAGLGAAMVRRLSRGLRSPSSSGDRTSHRGDRNRRDAGKETAARPTQPAAAARRFSAAARVNCSAIAQRVALEQLEALETPCAPEIAAGRLQSVASILRAEFAALGRSAAPLEPALATAMRDGDLAPLKALLPTLFGSRGRAEGRRASSREPLRR